MFTEGALAVRARCRGRGLTTRPSPQVVDGRGRRGHGHADRPVEARPGGARSPTRAGQGRCAGPPAPRPAHRRGPYPAYVDRSARCSAPGTSSSRAPRAPSDPRPATVGHGTFRTAAKRLRRRRGHGLRRRLPAADPPDRRTNRKGRNNTLVAGPGRPRLARGRSASPEGGHDAVAPRAGHDRGLRRASSRRATELGIEVALDFALQCSARPPVGDRAPGVVHHRAPTARSKYAENPPKKYQDIYPSTSTTTRRRLCAEVLRIVAALDRPRRADLPRRQPAHQAARVLGVADRRGPRDRPRRALPRRGVHPAGDDARAGEGRLPPVLHVLHLAQQPSGSSSEYLRELSRETGDVLPAELLRQHPRHPARVPAARRAAGVRDPRRARRDAVADLGRLLRLRALRARAGARRAARSTSTRRSTRSGRATGTPPSRGPHRWRRTSPGSTRSAARTRRCSSCATCTSTTATTTRCCAYSKRRRDGRRHRHRRRQPRPARHPRGHGPPRPARARPGLARVASPCTTSSPAQTWRLGRAQLRAARPAPASPPTSCSVRQDRVTDRPRASPASRRAPLRRDADDRRERPDPTGSSARSSTRCWSAAFSDSNGDGIRRPARPDREARLPAVARRRLPLAAAVLRLAAARRRLRHPRLPQGAARVRHRRGLRRAARRGARARHPRDHRPRHEPHLATRTRGSRSPARDPDGPVRRLLRLARRPTRATPTRGSSSSTPRRRTGPSTRCASSTTGTGSSPTSPT